jgi:hypothetical protein
LDENPAEIEENYKKRERERHQGKRPTLSLITYDTRISFMRHSNFQNRTIVAFWTLKTYLSFCTARLLSELSHRS